MQRSLILVCACLCSPVPMNAEVIACGVGREGPIQEALVDSGLSSIRAPIHVVVQGHPPDAYCDATLELSLSALPSRRLVPRPRELARELVGMAKAFGVRTCAIEVWLNDDVSRDAAERVPDDEACRNGMYRFDGGSWSEVIDDRSCFD